MLASTKISTVNGSHGDRGPEFLQDEGIGCRRTDLGGSQPGYKEGHGVHQVDGRFKLLGIEQAPGDGDSESDRGSPRFTGSVCMYC